MLSLKIIPDKYKDIFAYPKPPQPGKAGASHLAGKQINWPLIYYNLSQLATSPVVQQQAHRIFPHAKQHSPNILLFSTAVKTAGAIKHTCPGLKS